MLVLKPIAVHEEIKIQSLQEIHKFSHPTLTSPLPFLRVSHHHNSRIMNPQDPIALSAV